MGDRSYNIQGARPKFTSQENTCSSQEENKGQDGVAQKNVNHLCRTDRPIVQSNGLDSTNALEDTVENENCSVAKAHAPYQSCDLTRNTASSSPSLSFLHDVNEVCKDKSFTDREQILLSKWQQSGLRLWKLLHEREVKKKKKSQDIDSVGQIKTQGSDDLSLTRHCDSICPVTSQDPVPGCFIRESQGYKLHNPNSCQCSNTSISERADGYRSVYFDTSGSQGSDACHSSVRPLSQGPYPCCSNANLSLKPEPCCSVVCKTLGVTGSQCVKGLDQADLNHLPSKVFSIDCINQRDINLTPNQQFKSDRTRHTGMSCVHAGAISDTTCAVNDMAELSHDGKGMNSTEAQDQHEKLLGLSENQNLVSSEKVVTARNDDFVDSLDNDADIAEDAVSVSYKLHLLKAVDVNSSLFSSDSAVTDQSSACEWADGSSDAIGTEMNLNETKPPQKHFRKKGHTRSRSTDKEIVIEQHTSATRHMPGYSDSSEDDAHSGQGDEQNRSAGQHQYHTHSDDSEIEKCGFDSHNCSTSEQQSGIKDISQSFDESSGSSQSGESGCYKGCGPGILRLHYAIPYLSEKLKKSLAKRIENTGKKPSDVAYTALSEDIDYDITSGENENFSSEKEEIKGISELQSLETSQDLQTVDKFQSKIPTRLPVDSESIRYADTTVSLPVDVRNPTFSCPTVSCTFSTMSSSVIENRNKQNGNVVINLPNINQNKDRQSQICDNCDVGNCSDTCSLCACCGNVPDDIIGRCQQRTIKVGSCSCAKSLSNVAQLDSSCENVCTSYLPGNMVSVDRKDHSNVSFIPDNCHSSGDFHHQLDHTGTTEYEVHSSVCHKPAIELLKTNKDHSIASDMSDKKISKLNKEHSGTSYNSDTLCIKCCYQTRICDAVESESISSSCDEEKLPNNCCYVPDTYSNKSDNYCHSAGCCRKPDLCSDSFCHSFDCHPPKLKAYSYKTDNLHKSGTRSCHKEFCHTLDTCVSHKPEDIQPHIANIPTYSQHPSLDTRMTCDELHQKVCDQTPSYGQEPGLNLTLPSINVVSCENDFLPGRGDEEASHVTMICTELIEKNLDSTLDSISSDGSVVQSLLSSLSDEYVGKLPNGREIEEELSWGEPDYSREGDSGESESGEADDEFECDCDHCVLIRSHHQSSCQGQQGEGQGQSENGTTQSEDQRQQLDLLLSDSPGGGLYSISVAELSPLSNLMNNRRNELEQMFENVIMQMLAVHPDLMSDQTPPPANQTVIDSLPQTTASKEHLGQSCPICLCLYEEQERLSCLPCQHIFHQLCIQAWLVKSGTCPVCRKVL